MSVTTKKTGNGGLCKLYTNYGKELESTPWNVYPRPKMKRESFYNLNGKWLLEVWDEKKAYTKYEILVPFCPESVLSGVEKVFSEESILVYTRSFVCPDCKQGERVLLHFGGVDQIAKVYVNDVLVGQHVGGYTPFHIDVTDALQAENLLRVVVEDHLSSLVEPYGKQRKKRGGMWYTPVSGIWQTVWMEVVPATYIQSVNADMVGPFVEFTIKGVNSGKITIKTPEEEISLAFIDGKGKVELKNPRLWSPEDPYLYYFTVEGNGDKVESYFAVRTLEIKEVNGYKRLCLNGKPYFFHGLLDQGYFSDGIYTPAHPSMYTEEILRVKALGFNTLRKHIKIEPQIFYAECDRLGMIVWQDMLNNSDYKYVRDTVLPTIGFTWKWDKFIHRNKAHRRAFLKTMQKTVSLLKSHPCICLWTIFNEGWGQFESTKVYRSLKKMDSTRFIDSTSGWFQGGESDVESRHVYFKPVKGKKCKRPLIVSEFGGFTYSVKDHIFNTSQSYGYGACETREAYVQKLRAVYENEVIPAVKEGLCATIYTQVSDVEDEVNGLFTYDREVDKVLPEEFADIGEKLQKALE